jgi:hypothetical protein
MRYLFLWLLAFGTHAQDLVRCASAKKPKAQISYNKQLRIRESAEFEGKVLRVPVVFHVIHSNSQGTTGGQGNSNISTEQIQSQIDVLNEDFRKKTGTLGANNLSFSSDTEIEFFLAILDPSGNPTKGITRTFYSNKKTFNVDTDLELLSSLAYWDAKKYLNIWVTTFSGGILGYSALPHADVLGLPDTEPERIDGVFVDHRNVGRKTGTAVLAGERALYAYGRTLTHEIGHWMGLFHTWGDEFCGDDLIDDTPTAERANQSRFCTDRFSNCSGERTRNLIENYMDYSPDSCMNNFTNGQKARMRSALELDPRRRSVLLNGESQSLPSVLSTEIQIAPNPIIKSLFLRILYPQATAAKVLIYSLGGDLVIAKDYPMSTSFIDEIDVANLPLGQYILRFEYQNQAITKRILKI